MRSLTARIMRLCQLVGVITLLAGCASPAFDFDQVTTEGFSVTGVFDGATQQRVALCSTSQLNELLSLVPETEASSDAYALGLRSKPECFPRTTSTGFWRLDFVSPDLSGQAGWQQLRKLAFSMQTNVPGIVVQPLVRVQKSNGKEVFYLQTDELGQPKFFDVGQAQPWQRIEFELPNTTQGVTIREVQIRVFGPAGSSFTAPDQFVRLDRIIALRG